MYFNDTSTKNGAIQKCEDWLFGGDYGAISNNSTLLLKFTNLINTGLDKTKALIYKSDGRWQDDDVNFGDIPEATTDLSDGQGLYTLDSDMEMIEGFEVRDIDGNYRKVFPIDYSDIRYIDSTITEFYKDDGLPLYYDVKGNQVQLFPAPATANVTMDEGLKIVYKRESKYFVSTDTTTELGIPRMFHDIPCLFACSEYASMNSMTQKITDIENKLFKRSEELKAHYNQRQKDEQGVLTSETVISI